MNATIQLRKHDNYQYGEHFEVVVTMENGNTFACKIQEHQFNNLKQFFGEPVKSGQFGQDELYS